MVARYAPPVSYNFLNLIRLGKNKTTIFEQRMENIDNAVPFFGGEFNKIYPIIMVIYTLLVASNFFDKVFNFLGSWKRYIFKTEAEDMDGFDPSGLIILQKERSWLEQGCKVGEQVVPLARNFNNIDIESGNNYLRNGAEMKASSNLITDEIDGSVSRTSKEDTSRSREAINNKYAVIREQQGGPASKLKSEEKNVAFADSSNSAGGPSSGLTSTWQSMKTGFQSFRANIGAKKFLPLRQIQENNASGDSSSESLDDIFQRLKRPNLNQSIYNDDD